MAAISSLPNQIADELKAHHAEFVLETALWDGDVTDLGRWPEYSAAGIDARRAALLEIAARAEAVPTAGTVERNLVEAVAFSARADAAQLARDASVVSSGAPGGRRARANNNDDCAIPPCRRVGDLARRSTR